MRRGPATLTGLMVLLAGLSQPALGQRSAAPAGVTVTIAGEGVATWPAYDARIERFAIDTSEATGGVVEVTVTADDPAARVRVDGVSVGSGNAHTVDALQPGDEVNVQVSAIDGATNQSWIYLPGDFPRLTTTGSDPGNGPVFLGLSNFAADTGFETVVDAHGVPLHVREAKQANDFRALEEGPEYSVFEPVVGGGHQVREYDSEFRLDDVERLRPDVEVGVTPDDTDFHDVQYLPDGRMVLVGHHPDVHDDGTEWIDAVLQVVDRDGGAVFTWSSQGHVDPTEGYVHGARGQDYIHVNSVEMQPDGDLVASFRNTGQILRIATEAHDGFEPGDVVWRLGGERNEFTFVNDPYGGFCAQHDARVLANGHLLVFDNGSRRDANGPISPQTADMCPDPADPGGGRIARPQSRIVEYALDTDAMTATQVWSFVPQGRYAALAGNSQRLDDGSTLVGWSLSETEDGAGAPVASRVSAAGEEVWSLRASDWFSYRAYSFPAPDEISPRIRVVFPRPHARYPEGTDLTPRFTCHDRGGSNLTDCRVVSVTGGPRDSPGRHAITFNAGDGNGNQVQRRFSYVVDPLRQPDLQVRTDDSDWLGDGRWPEKKVVHAADRFTAAGQVVTYPARVFNAGFEGESYQMTARRGGGGWSVRYLRGRRDLTRQLINGMLSPRLNPGQSWGFRVVVRRTARVDDGQERLSWVRARSTMNPTRRDRITVESRAR